MPARSTPHESPRRGRRLRAAALLALLFVLAGLGLLRGQSRFDGYVTGPDGTPAHVLRQGQRAATVFADRDRADTRYEIVSTAAGGSTRYGLGGRTGARGHASRLGISSLGRPARVSVRWLVAGRTVARWVYLVRPPKRAR